jgi:hypothetical protein
MRGSGPCGVRREYVVSCGWACVRFRGGAVFRADAGAAVVANAQSHPNTPSRLDLILHLSSCSVFAAVVAIRGVAFVPHSSSIVPLPLLSCLCGPQKLLFGR